jgi:OmpA-OmpF porin, OOP family
LSFLGFSTPEHESHAASINNSSAFRRNYMKQTPNSQRRAFRLLALAIPLAMPVAAIAQDDSGWYGGLSAGRAFADIDSNRIRAALQAGGNTVASMQKDDEETTFKLLGGYSFNKNWALEGSYFNLGNFDFNANTQAGAFQRGDISRLSGVGIDLVGSLPLKDNLSVFARLGINNAGVKERYFGTAPGGANFPNRTERGWNEKFGVGVQYDVNRRFSLRAEVESYGLESSLMLRDRVDTVTVGGIFRFGRPPAPVVAQAPAPAPAPTPAPPPPPPQMMEVTLQASSLFDFDQTEIKASGRQELDRLARDINGMTYDTVLVVGHTDRIGSRDYNIRLSERRANAVRDYLVSAGIPAARITARGVNSDQPVTRPDQCRNTGSAAAQIACLEPDRRVVVVVTGTRPAQ